MSDKERLDAFFARIETDDTLRPFALILKSQLALASAAAVVQVADLLAAHWAASANVPQESST